MKNFAIVILNYNTFEDTVVCVDSIRNFTTEKSYKIFVVDNASPDKSGELLFAKYENDANVAVLLSKKNLGFSGGNNIGIYAALKENFDIVYLLNSDIVLQNDAFKYMQEAFNANQNVAIVGPYIVNPENQYAQFARKGISLKSYLLSLRFFLTFFPKINKNSRYYKYSFDEDFIFDGIVHGSCFGMTADFIKQTKSLDDNLFMYYEEDILSYKLHNAEKKAMIVANAKILHNEASSTKKSNSDRMLFTRFYRWTSVLYVLKNYAKVNGFLCSLLALQNIMFWLMLSIRKESYRQKLKAFVCENKRILTVDLK